MLALTNTIITKNYEAHTAASTFYDGHFGSYVQLSNNDVLRIDFGMNYYIRTILLDTYNCLSKKNIQVIKAK